MSAVQAPVAVGPCGHGAEYLRTRRDGKKVCTACRSARGARNRKRKQAEWAALREAGRRRPLVLGATRATLEQAARLMPQGRILEVEITRAISAGTIRNDGDNFIVSLYDLGLQAVVRRAESRVTGRRAWQPIQLRRGGRIQPLERRSRT